jgi:hypothetical protein
MAPGALNTYPDATVPVTSVVVAADAATGMTITTTNASTKPNAKILFFIFFSLVIY